MKNFMKSRALIPVFVTTLVLIQLYRWFPLIWYSPEVRARVVNEKGKPVADAVVVASWNISGRRNGSTLGQAALIEVTTDKDGWFRIPSWGPILLWKGFIVDEDPTVYIIRPDFVPLALSNSDFGLHKAWPIIFFRYQDQTLTLKSWPEKHADREMALFHIYSGFRHILYMRPLHSHCYTYYIPRFLAALRRTKAEQIGKSDLVSSLDNIGLGEFENLNCFGKGSP